MIKITYKYPLAEIEIDGVVIKDCTAIDIHIGVHDLPLITLTRLVRPLRITPDNKVESVCNTFNAPDMAITASGARRVQPPIRDDGTPDLTRNMAREAE